MIAGEWPGRPVRRGGDLIDLVRSTRYDREGPDALREAERRATAIVVFDTLVVPALLQTPEYASAAMADGGARERLARQEVLRGTVLCEVFVHEAALRTWAGNARIMAAQLRRIATEDRVRTRLVPFSAGNRAELRHPFALLETADGPAVHTEPPNVLSARPEVVARHEAAVEVLRAAAWDTARSRAEFLRRADRYEAP